MNSSAFTFALLGLDSVVNIQTYNSFKNAFFKTPNMWLLTGKVSLELGDVSQFGVHFVVVAIG